MWEDRALTYKIPPPKSTLDVLTDHLAQQGSLNIPGQ